MWICLDCVCGLGQWKMRMARLAGRNHYGAHPGKRHEELGARSRQDEPARVYHSEIVLDDVFCS
jgi:hypothetical protein